MYQIQLINPLFQFGTRGYTLIFNDESGVYPPFRTDIQFANDATDLECINAVVDTINAWSQSIVISESLAEPYAIPYSDDLLLNINSLDVSLVHGICEPNLTESFIVVDEIGGTKLIWQL